MSQKYKIELNQALLNQAYDIIESNVCIVLIR